MDIPIILWQRDRAAFDWLYTRYAGMLFGIIRKMVADNAAAERLLEETFIDAWKSLDEFDGMAGDVFIRMLRIAREKANGHLKAGSCEDPQSEANKLNYWTSSVSQQPAGQKQYSNS